MTSKCKFRKSNGKLCNANAQVANSLCVFHDPARATDGRRARREGGLQRSRRASVFPLETPEASLKNSLDVSLLLAESINAVRKGQLDPRVSNAISYLAGILLRALELPRTGSMLSKSYLRPAAINAGVVLQEGQRFGFHNLRHSLATFLVNIKTDVKTVQSLLRHANSQLTLNCYSHAKDNSKLAAQGEVLAAMFPQQSGASVN